MTITYVQTITPWTASTNPAASGSFTPAAGDAILVAGVDYTNGSETMSFTGTGTYSLLTPPGSFTDNNGNSLGIGANSSASSGAQTTSVASSGFGNDEMFGFAIEYAGVSSIGGNENLVEAPGTGTGAITGVATLVPTGSILVALCIAVGGVSTAPTTTGTSRGSGSVGSTVGYCFAEWAGSGGSITPAFTAPSGGGSGHYDVMQWLLSGGGIAPSKSQFFMSKLLPLAPLAWIIRRRNKLAG